MKYLLLILSICFFVSCATTKEEYCVDNGYIAEKCEEEWKEHQENIKEEKRRMHGHHDYPMNQRYR